MSLRVRRSYLKGKIAEERRIHTARALGHEIAELEAKANKSDKNTLRTELKLERVRAKQQELMFGLDKDVLKYIEEANNSLSSRGKKLFGNRGRRLLTYDLVSRLLGWALPRKTYLRLALKAKDLGTITHLRGVVPIAVAIFKNLPGKEIGRYSFTASDVVDAASLHDVGKLEVPSHVLRKTSELSARDKELLRMHSEYGEELLRDWSADKKTRDVARQHHMYGSIPYPEKREGETITPLSRIVTVADAIERMSSGRHGNAPMDKTAIARELREHYGEQFYGPYVDAFLNAVKKDAFFRKWWNEREKEMIKSNPAERQEPRRQREIGLRKYDQNR